MTFAVVLMKDARNPRLMNAMVSVLPGCQVRGRGEREALIKAKGAIRNHLKRLSHLDPALARKVKCLKISKEEFDLMGI
jgi:hypothetical protein